MATNGGRSDTNTSTKQAVRSLRRGAGISLAVVLSAAVLLAACGATSHHTASRPTSPADGSTSRSPTTESGGTSATLLLPPPATNPGGQTKASPAPRAQNLQVTSEVRAQLLAAGAASYGLTSEDYVGLTPGETYYAVDGLGVYWAGAALNPSPSSTPAQVSSQDDGAYLLFERPVGGAWKVFDVGMAGIAGSRCPIAVPPPVLALWGWPAASCRPGQATSTTLPPSAAPRLAAPMPSLGVAGARFEGVGFGQVRPARVFLGGDPTGDLTRISWNSWGGTQAVGTGISLYVSPHEITAAGTEQEATVVAFDPGTCDGSYVYQAVEWYFPQHDGYFDPGYYVNACTGTYVPFNGGEFR
jgi:hypothetical protein